MSLAWLTASVLAVLCSVVASLLNDIVSEPYMDEIFHVPQAKRYCDGNFSYWDPMITTPPGLYVSSVLWMNTLSRLVDSDLCTLTYLRGQNVVFITLLFLVIHSILKDGNGKESLYTMLSAFNLTIFPVLFFFTFLYYTDVGATLFVLAGYWLARKDSHLLSAACLLISLCFRQTCVVWLVFVMSSVAIRTVESAPETRQYKDKSWTLQYPVSICRYLLTHVPDMLRLLWPYLVVHALFLAFVLGNGSVAMGDKTHHTVTFHAPQLFYFFAFAVVLSPSKLLDVGLARRFLAFLARDWRWTLCVFAALVVVMGVSVHNFTYAHPYLLADNRHFPFYLWKNVFRRHAAIKYLLVPLYAVAGVYLLYTLSASSSHSSLWLLCYLVCCAASMVPQKLLEFRYFILPFLVFRIHSREEGDHRRGGRNGGRDLLPLLAEMVCYLALNGVTLWLFLYRAFRWPDSSDWQRFMW